MKLAAFRSRMGVGMGGAWMGHWRVVSISGGKREVYRNGERAHAMERLYEVAIG